MSQKYWLLDLVSARTSITRGTSQSTRVGVVPDPGQASLGGSGLPPVIAKIGRVAHTAIEMGIESAIQGIATRHVGPR